MNWIVVLLVLALVALTALLVAAGLRVRHLTSRYAPILDVEQAVEHARREHERLMHAARVAADEMAAQRNDFHQRYAEAQRELERLTREIGVFEEQADLQSVGLYKPHFDYGTAEGYKLALEQVRSHQAAMLKARTAAFCAQTWTVEGSAAKGKQMTDRTIRLLLHAFNGECDAAVARVRFNNIGAMEERVDKTFEKLNKLGEPTSCAISPGYRQLKLDELRLTHEYEEKVQAEKDEQRRIREQMREEERAQKEIEKALEDAERDEERNRIALDKARAELESANERQRAKLLGKVAELEKRLAEAH